MNNKVIVLAVVATLAVAVSASEFEHGGEFGHGGFHGPHEIGGHHLGPGPVVIPRRGGHGRGRLSGGFEGERDFDDREVDVGLSLREREREGRDRFGAGGSIGRSGRARRGFRGGFRPGFEGGAIGGGFGGSQESGLVAGEREGFNEAGFAEGKRGGLIANKKGLRTNQFNANNDDLDTVHKHNAVDKDTLVVKNNVKAVNDEDAVHSHRGNVNSNSLGAGSENLAAFGEEGRVGGFKSGNRESGIAANQGSRFGAAGGAAGVVA